MLAADFLSKPDFQHDIFFISGQEDFFIDKIKKIIINSFGCDELNTDYFSDACSVDQIISISDQLPFFAENRIVIINEPAFLKTGKNDDAAEKTTGNINSSEQFLNYLKTKPASTKMLIIMKDAPDKRRSIYKYLSKNSLMIEADAIQEDVLIKWINQQAVKMGLSFSERQMDLLLQVCGRDMMVLENEIKKLSMYKTDRLTDKELLQILSASDEYNVFLLHEYMTSGDYDNAFELTDKIFAGEKSFIPLLGLLSKKFDQMLAAKQLLEMGMTKNQAISILSAEMKISSGVAYYAVSDSKPFTSEMLKSGLHELYSADLALKTGGKFGGIEELLLKIYKNV